MTNRDPKHAYPFNPKDEIEELRKEVAELREQLAKLRQEVSPAVLSSMRFG